MADASVVELGPSEPSPPVHSVPSKTIHGRSPTKIALDRLRRDKIALTCAAIVVVFVLIAIFADVITSVTGTDPFDTNQDLLDVYNRPTIITNGDHPLGIEPGLGRDLFARFVHGARPSLIVGVFGALFAAIVGTVLGMLAGFRGGWVDRVISWVIDFMLSIPLLLVAIAAAPVVQSWFAPQLVGQVRLWTLVVVFGLFGWTQLARLVRAEVLSLREREFIQAARIIGLPTRRVLFRELLPNVSGQIIVFTSLAIPNMIAGEAGLSFLGVGLVEPVPSWGRTISDASQSWYDTYPIYFWPPALAILLLVLSLNLLGDAIRDAFDPKTRR